MPRYLIRAGVVRLSIGGRQAGDRLEMFIGIETDVELDCDDPRWGRHAPVSAEGMTEEELASFGVTKFHHVAP